MINFLEERLREKKEKGWERLLVKMVRNLLNYSALCLLSSSLSFPFKKKIVNIGKKLYLSACLSVLICEFISRCLPCA